MSLLDNIKCLYNKNGKLNSRAIISEKNKQLRDNIIKQTSFLPDTTSWSERIYCIQNNITERQLCPYTSKPLFFKLQPFPSYCKVSGRENIAKTRKTNISKLKTSLQHAHSEAKNNLIKCYKNDAYELLSRDRCIAFIEDRFKQTINGTKGRYINTKHYKHNINILCSILHYCKEHILYPINWAEMFYLLYHNKTPQTSKDGIRLDFDTFERGYKNFHTNKDRTSHHFDTIITPKIKSQHFNILTQHKCIGQTI